MSKKRNNRNGKKTPACKKQKQPERQANQLLRIEAMCILIALGVIIGAVILMVVFSALEDKLEPIALQKIAEKPEKQPISNIDGDTSDIDKDIVEFFTTYVRPVLMEQFDKGQHPVSEVNAYLAEKKQAISLLYDSKLMIKMSDKPGVGGRMMGISASEEKTEPKIWLFVPSLREEFDKILAENPNYGVEVFQSLVLCKVVSGIETLLHTKSGPTNSDERIERDIFATGAFCSFLNMLAENGIPLHSEYVDIREKWNELGHDATSPAWREHVVECRNNGLDKLAEDQAMSRYSPEEMGRFYQAKIGPIIDALLKGEFPLAEIQKNFNELRNTAKKRFNSNLEINGVGQYLPSTKDALAGASVVDGIPTIVIITPTIMDMYKEDRISDSALDNSIIIDMMHELQHLCFSAHDYENITFRDHIADEIHINALTCENITRIFAEHNLPFCRSSEIYYEKWVKAGRDENNPFWRKFIHDLYQKAGR